MSGSVKMRFNMGSGERNQFGSEIAQRLAPSYWSGAINKDRVSFGARDRGVGSGTLGGWLLVAADVAPVEFHPPAVDKELDRVEDGVSHDADDEASEAEVSEA